MKAIIDLIIGFVFVITATTGAVKFYQALEKDLVIKLSKGLPPLTTLTRKMTKTKYDWESPSQSK
ncbi:MAG: hypothetical protein HQK49_22600 [Oligoflexia bacterium]|nr:hypothetical protein [Oligoflexia bacterium]